MGGRAELLLRLRGGKNSRVPPHRAPTLRRTSGTHFVLVQPRTLRRAQARALARARIDLTYNEIGDDGVAPLAASSSLPSLRSLDLSGNPFGAGGLSALAELWVGEHPANDSPGSARAIEALKAWFGAAVYV